MTSDTTYSGDVLTRHNVRVVGKGERPLVLVHGYGCNQTMWRHMVPAFEEDFKVVLFDHIGTATTGLAGWEAEAYTSLERYAADLCAVIEHLDLRDAVLVGHSVSSMICGLAAAQLGDRVAAVVMIGPSPHYLNDGDYRGGFERADIDELLNNVESNYQGWSAAMAPAIMGRPDAPAMGEELTERFCEQDPKVAYHFARATFLSDNREDLSRMTFPVLVLQCSDDIIAPEQVGEYTAATLPQGTYKKLSAKGHCPNLSAPQETATAILDFLAALHD